MPAPKHFGKVSVSYVDGENIVIEWRHQIARVEMNVIVTGGGRATGPAKNAARMLPFAGHINIVDGPLAR